MVGIPMPSINEIIIVRTNDKNILLFPTLIITCPIVLAIPVSVNVPITIPTTAQAIPTGSAVFAPSANASLQSINVFLPPLDKKFQTIKTSNVNIITEEPILKKPEDTKPRAIQKINLIVFDENPKAIELPKIKKVVRINPIVPEYSGV
jgi:hypothetical protein